jgi:serine/threonine-protein kinase RsbW/stage II sporulation protein AB (anti-sigma F factor)
MRAQRDGDRLLVAIGGELDLTTAPELEELLLASAPYVDLELDFAELDFIDSSGLRLLLGERERAARDGGRLLVTGAQGPVARVFAVSGLDAHLEPRLPGAHPRPSSPPELQPAAPDAFAEVYPADPPSVSAIRHRLCDWARVLGIREEVVGAIGLAVSEATTNVVVHAYADEPETGTVAVEAGLEGDVLWVKVGDEGRGMRPRPDSPGLGLGLPLIAQMTDGFEVHEAETGGTEVRMRFTL